MPSGRSQRRHKAPSYDEGDTEDGLCGTPGIPNITTPLPRFRRGPGWARVIDDPRTGAGPNWDSQDCGRSGDLNITAPLPAMIPGRAPGDRVSCHPTIPERAQGPIPQPEGSISTNDAGDGAPGNACNADQTDGERDQCRAALAGQAVRAAVRRRQRPSATAQVSHRQAQGHDTAGLGDRRRRGHGRSDRLAGSRRSDWRLGHRFAAVCDDVSRAVENDDQVRADSEAVLPVRVLGQQIEV